jgi:hypothetical protein
MSSHWFKGKIVTGKKLSFFKIAEPQMAGGHKKAVA